MYRATFNFNINDQGMLWSHFTSAILLTNQIQKLKLIATDCFSLSPTQSSLLVSIWCYHYHLAIFSFTQTGCFDYSGTGLTTLKNAVYKLQHKMGGKTLSTFIKNSKDTSQKVSKKLL